MVGFLIVGFLAVSGRGKIVGKWLAAGVLYMGVIGAFSTVYLSPVYASIDFFSEWYMASNLIAHSVLLLGCIYLVTGGFVKIKFSNILPLFLLGCIYLLIGGLNTLFFMMLKLDYAGINPMYFFKPFGDIPHLLGLTLFAIALAVTFVFTLLYEFLFIKPASRFYKNPTKDYWLYQ
jgi:hypothetical protein